MRIGPPQTERERLAALRTLHRRETRRFDAGVCVSMEAIVAAWDRDRPLAVALCKAEPDTTAYVWPPESDHDGDAIDQYGPAILEAIASRVDSLGCPLALCVTATDREDQRRVLVQAAFREIGEIRKLRRSLDDTSPEPVSSRLPDRNEWVPFHDDTADRFAAVIDRVSASESESDHAMHLSGAVTLAAFLADGRPSRDGWRLLTRQGQDIAVVLSQDLPDCNAREITYLGVVPEYRRAGIGTMLVDSVLAAARDAGCREVVVIANSADAAATLLYSRLGFLAIDRRIGFVRLRGDTCESGGRAVHSDLH